MTVSELIRELQQFNGNTPVEILVGNAPAATPVRVETHSGFSAVYIACKP